VKVVSSVDQFINIVIMSQYSQPKSASGNPFNDILQSTKKVDTKSIQQVDEIFRDEQLSPCSPARTFLLEEEDNVEKECNYSRPPRINLPAVLPDLQGEVEDLVKKLKSIIGDFDTRDLDDKVSSLLKSQKLQEKSRTALVPTFEDDTPAKTTYSAASSAFSPRTCSKQLLSTGKNFQILQKQPFNNSMDRLSPATVISTEMEIHQSSSRLITSNRYSVGLNIFSQSKNVTLDLAHKIISSGGAGGSSGNVLNSTGKGKARETILSIPLAKGSKDDVLAVDTTSTNSLNADNAISFKNSTVKLSEEGKKEESLRGFVEFSVMSVLPEYLTGKKRLNRSNYQPTSIVNRYPHDKVPIVDNLHEYLFPFGAKLLSLRLSEWRRKKKTKEFEPKYQIMQFTDETHHIYHAYCIIVYERTHVSNPLIIRQLEQLHIMTLAANLIKRTLRFYLARKNENHLRGISSKWKDNVTNASRLPSFSDFYPSYQNDDDRSVRSDIPFAYSNQEKSSSSLKQKSGVKSFFKAVKSQFTGSKHSTKKKVQGISDNNSEIGDFSRLTVNNVKKEQNQQQQQPSSWKFPFKSGKSSRKKKGTLSTKSSESSGSYVSSSTGHYHTDDGYIHSIYSTNYGNQHYPQNFAPDHLSNRNANTLGAQMLTVDSPKKERRPSLPMTFDDQPPIQVRRSMEFNGFPSSVQPISVPGSTAASTGYDSDGNNSHLSTIKRSNSVWAALETSTCDNINSNTANGSPAYLRRSSAGGGSPASVKSATAASYENPYQFYLRRNLVTNTANSSPRSSPGLLKRTGSASSTSDAFSETSSRAKNELLRKPLKSIRSIKSIKSTLDVMNKKVVIRQKALCFLTELPMPSIFFRVKIVSL
jgi:hypothetical protein